MLPNNKMILNNLRLTPAYFAIIALYATWLPKLGTGPMWDRRMNLEQERCQSSWWLNLLYINNYVGNDKLVRHYIRIRIRIRINKIN